MSFLNAILIGIVQGATEFLPVSSKAHIEFAGRLLGVREVPIDFVVVLHMGTLLAVVVFFRRDLCAILRSLLPGGPAEGEEADARRVNRRLFLYLLLGTIPAAVIGGLFQKHIEAALYRPFLYGCGLLVTAAILTVASRLQGRKDLAAMTAKDALLVGIAQTCALLPGVSRSGSTITGALACGLDREAAPRFAFLLSVPVIIGAFLLELHHMLKQHAALALDPLLYIFGALVAAITGYLAILLVINSVKRGNLLYFAAYCAVVGLAAIAMKLFHLS